MPTDQTPISEPLQDLPAGSHSCCLYENTGQRRALRLEMWLKSLGSAREAQEGLGSAHSKLARSKLDHSELEKLVEERTRDLQEEIEERRKMEALLRESEASYRFLVENQMDLIARAQPDGTLTFVNQALCSYFGQTAEEMVGRNYLEYLEEASRVEMAPVMETIRERVIPEDAIFVTDYQVVDGRGNLAWQRWTNRGIFDEGGNLVEILSVGRDITSSKQAELDIQQAQVEMEQRVLERTIELMNANRQLQIDINERCHAEQALRESEARFRWLVNSLDDIVFTMDSEARWTALYGRLQEKIGFPADFLIGKSIGEVMSGEKARLHLEAFERVLGGESLIYDWDFKGPEGIIHFQISAAPLRDSEGQTIGVVGLGRDISAQKWAELALRESEERFRLLYERAPLGYQSLDTQARFIDVNTTWKEMMGYSREEVSGRYFGDFMTPRSAELLPTRFARFMEEGEVYGAEFEMVRKDGSVFIASFNGKLGRDPARGFIQTHCIMEDVTEKRRAEEQMKASLAEKEVMLREIHHRVKNNLQVMASLLSLQAESVADPAALTAFQESRQRIRSMALVHEELYQSHNLALIDLEQYLRKLTFYLHSAYHSGSRVEIDFQAEVIRLSVEKAIPCGLIVNELVSNSMKYAFRGREEGVISISMRCRGDEVEVRVADNGVGLPAGFEVSRSDTLGLQLVSILTGQLNGRLEVESGPGAAFRLVFPVG